MTPAEKWNALMTEYYAKQSSTVHPSANGLGIINGQFGYMGTAQIGASKPLFEGYLRRAYTRVLSQVAVQEAESVYDLMPVAENERGISKSILAELRNDL